jgi:hypothetical protein
LLVQGTHVPDAASQTGFAPPQRLAFVAEQTPQVPFGWQAGVAPPHWASLVQPEHVCVERLHTGVVPPQSAFDVQPTHTPVARWHDGVAPTQAFMLVAEHCAQAPDGWHAGVAPPQS